jgi:partner of Y14 and mago protein
MPTVAISKAGITTSSSGERIIPASTRPDGTVRKEIRVKPGYRPPEDVELYKNRTAEGFRNRGKAGVPGAGALKTEDDPSKLGAAANKNAKRREARKKAAAAASDEKEEEKLEESEAAKGSKTSEKEELVAPAAEPAKPTDPDAEKETEKEAKKLMKKLGQGAQGQEGEGRQAAAGAVRESHQDQRADPPVGGPGVRRSRRKEARDLKAYQRSQHTHNSCRDGLRCWNYSIPRTMLV